MSAARSPDGGRARWWWCRDATERVPATCRTPGVARCRARRRWLDAAAAPADVAVPAVNRLGEEGQGFSIAMEGLDGGRINIATCSVGTAQQAIVDATAYVQDRKQFDSSPSSTKKLLSILSWLCRYVQNVEYKGSDNPCSDSYLFNLVIRVPQHIGACGIVIHSLIVQAQTACNMT